MQTVQVDDFSAWRTRARELINSGIPPHEIVWTSDDLLPGLGSATGCSAGHAPARTFDVPAAFIPLATRVAYHRDREKWPLLYRVLWRITHGESKLLEIAVDPDVHILLAMEKEVRRDAHKMKAFVRFRKVEGKDAEHYVAWHRPDHLILRLVAPFFVERFRVMHWTILTPDESVAWDGSALRFAPGVPRSNAPGPDELEDMWRTYYGAVFNPARIKVKAMRKEMPLRHWATLPETTIIDDLLRDAPRRVQTMIERGVSSVAASAAPFIPPDAGLADLAKAAAHCQGCPLHCRATQTVFGEGPDEAKVMFIGEQPGDQEDLAGKPFVGPAGQLFDQALREAGIDRSAVYVTNAVKHFKWEPRGKRRIHAKPSAREMAACRPWLQAEIGALRPQLIVCLGATAAQTLLGASFRVIPNRGRVLTNTSFAPRLMTTVHPSSILRTPDPSTQQAAYSRFLGELKQIA